MMNPNRTNALIIIVACVIVACVIYVLFLLILRAITKDDLLMMPKGNKIVTVLEKYRLIR